MKRVLLAALLCVAMSAPLCAQDPPTTTDPPPVAPLYTMQAWGNVNPFVLLQLQQMAVTKPGEVTVRYERRGFLGFRRWAYVQKVRVQ